MTGEVDDERAAALPGRFLGEVRSLAPLVAVWAHGSLAMGHGDYRHGRSDLDVIAVIERKLDERESRGVRLLHEELIRQVPVARKLHCGYVVRDRLGETGRRHATFAMGDFFERTLTPVSRRELLTGDLALFGPAPSALLPTVTDEELAAFVRAEMAGVWRPVTAKWRPWLHDDWVDFGPLAVARAAVTLRDGRLISKREALEVLTVMGAPGELVADIRARRYEPRPPHVGWWWRARRARMVREFVRESIDSALS